jgi:hypothetical protein
MPVTAAFVLPRTLASSETRDRLRGDAAMEATYFREKAETCLRLARGLSWNNPARGELTELAEEFHRQADEIEAAASPQQSRAR